jgi:hypothetical protein
MAFEAVLAKEVRTTFENFDFSILKVRFKADLASVFFYLCWQNVAL